MKTYKCESCRMWQADPRHRKMDGGLPKYFCPLRNDYTAYYHQCKDFERYKGKRRANIRNLNRLNEEEIQAIREQAKAEWLQTYTTALVQACNEHGSLTMVDIIHIAEELEESNECTT